MADYTPKQKAFIVKMNQVDAQHRATAQARSTSGAPYARSGKVQAPSARGPKIPKPKTVKVKAHKRTVTSTGGTAAPAAPTNPDQSLIDAAVRLRYGPQEQALGQQLQQNTRFTSGLGDWYSNALNEMQGLQAAQHTQAQQTLGQVQAYNSPATLANPADQQAANARNSLNAQFANQFARDEGANSAAMDRLGAALQIQQGNTRNQANLDRTRLIGQQGALGAQKADYATTYGGQLAQAEQTAAQKAQANEIAAKALGIKADTLNKVQIPLAQSLSSDRTAKERVARTNARTQRQNARTKRKALVEKTATDNSALDIKRQAANTTATGDSLKRSQFIAKYGLPPEKVSNMTPGQLSHFAKKNPQFSGYARPPASKNTAKPLTQGQAKGRQGILDSITRYQTGTKHGEALTKIAGDGRKHGVNEALLHAGADAVSHGYVLPATVRLLEQVGYTVPTEWTRRGAFPITYKGT